MEARRENLTGQREFYHLHWPRSQRFFAKGPKILAVRKCGIPTFVYTDAEAYVMMAFNVIMTDRLDLKFLCGLLNSDVIYFWLKNRGKMQGHNFQVDKEPLLALPIYAPTVAEQRRIGKLVDKVIERRLDLDKALTSAERERAERTLKQGENAVQESIAALYELTGDEREVLKLG